MNSFAAALILSVLAGMAAMALVMFFAKYRPDLLAMGILASTAVRLLLMATGTIIVLFLTKIDGVRFVIWVSVFYVLALIWEIRFAMQMVNKVKTLRGDGV
jgi:hypothetical protein